MKGTEKTHAGKYLIVTIIVVAVAVAFLSRSFYTAERPASTEARLVDDRIVLAHFPPEAAKLIRNGMKATISLNGVRHTGVVSGRDLMQEHAYVITLDPTPPPPAPGTPCTVLVDATIPPELIK